MSQLRLKSEFRNGDQRQLIQGGNRARLVAQRLFRRHETSRALMGSTLSDVQSGQFKSRQLSRTHRLPLGTNTRAALMPHGSHHIEYVAVPIEVSTGQLLPDVSSTR
jgi:hypothetical protein